MAVCSIRETLACSADVLGQFNMQGIVLWGNKPASGGAGGALGTLDGALVKA